MNLTKYLSCRSDGPKNQQGVFNFQVGDIRSICSSPCSRYTVPSTVISSQHRPHSALVGVLAISFPPLPSSTTSPPLSPFPPLPFTSLKRPRLPLARILDARRNVMAALLDAGARLGDAASDGGAGAPRGALDRLADAARRRAHDAADGVRQAADRVAEGRGDELHARGRARVLLADGHGEEMGLVRGVDWIGCCCVLLWCCFRLI